MFLDRLKVIFHPFVILAGIVFACSLFALTAFVVNGLKPDASVRPVGTALLQVVAAPTDTPVLPTLPPTDTPTPEPGTPLPPPPGVISVGSYVQITGTGTDGLRMRSQAGLQGDIRFLAIEAEVFEVVDGPQESDGYTWWFLQAPYDEQVQGWAVSNYLSLVHNP
jgi:hypothetical protein